MSKKNNKSFYQKLLYKAPLTLSRMFKVFIMPNKNLKIKNLFLERKLAVINTNQQNLNNIKSIIMKNLSYKKIMLGFMTSKKYSKCLLK